MTFDAVDGLEIRNESDKRRGGHGTVTFSRTPHKTPVAGVGPICSIVVASTEATSWSPSNCIAYLSDKAHN